MNDYLKKIVDEKMYDINEGLNVYSYGKVTKIQDYIVEIEGLDGVTFFEGINIANKAFGYVNYIKENSVVAAIMQVNEPIYIGDLVYTTKEEFKAKFSVDSLGKIVDIFGLDHLESKYFSNLVSLNIENKPISIMDRRTVEEPLETGISGIDLIFPIGKGQRQLIIGDKKIGKTQICLDMVVNQKDKNITCIYIAVGKTKKEVKEIYEELLKRGAMQYTMILTAFNDQTPPLLYLTPYVGVTIAEAYMRELKKDVLVVIDDLKRHADAYRELTLLSGKTPGREAYPADIFYAHSRLLERGCVYKNGGSITIIPISETKGGDITDYISTNIISITDGQIVLSAKNFQKGQKPAINYALSVSRLGGAVQSEEAKNAGAIVRRELLNYLEIQDVYGMANEEELAPEQRNKLLFGRQIIEKLNQYKYEPRTIKESINCFDFVLKYKQKEADAGSNNVKT